MSHLHKIGSHLPCMLIARLQVSRRWEREAVVWNLAGLGGRKGGSRVQEVAAVLCRLLAVEHLAEHFETQMSPRNRYKKVPQAVSDTGAWAFFCLRLSLPPFVSEYAAFPLRRTGVGRIWGLCCLFVSPLLRSVAGEPLGKGRQKQDRNRDEHQSVRMILET